MKNCELLRRFQGDSMTVKSQRRVRGCLKAFYAINRVNTILVRVVLAGRAGMGAPDEVVFIDELG